MVDAVALEAGTAADLAGAGRCADFDTVGVAGAAGAAAPLGEPAELEPAELDDGALAAGEDWPPLEDWPPEDWLPEDWLPEVWLSEGAVDWLELPVPEVDADWLVDAGTWVTVGAELLTVWVSVLTTDPTVLVTGSVTD